jgi:soluble lytic murein transglycosylase-like protein
VTLQHFLRTATVAILGATALFFASQAKAESGEGNGVVPPVDAEIEGAQNVAAAVAIEAAEAGAANAKKPAKAAKGGAEQNLKMAAVGKQTSVEGAPLETVADFSGSQAVQDGIPDVEVTSAILPGRSEARLGVKLVDTIRADTIRPLIARHASENGVPFALVDAVVRIESRYNPGARNGVNVGLTQINVRTAQSLGYRGGASGLLDAETNLRYGVKYLAQAYKLAGGDTCGTVLRYQSGHRAETMNRASRAYCGKVKTLIAASS